jgi:hypothetical protein
MYLPLTALIVIAERRRKIHTCTQTRKTTGAKFERLRSALIRCDLKDTKLDMQMLQK